MLITITIGLQIRQDGELASGFSIEEMGEAAKAIDNPTDEKAKILVKVEKTDMFERMVYIAYISVI